VTPALIYVHGIGNKPPLEVLKAQWDVALAQRPLDESRMCYWVSRERYPEPLLLNWQGPDLGEAHGPGPAGSARLGFLGGQGELPISDEVEALSQDKEERQWLKGMASAMIGEAMTVPSSRLGLLGVDTSMPLIPRLVASLLPDQIKFPVIRRITRAFLGDCHEFFFVRERREAMTACLRDQLKKVGRPVVLVTHSQGSLITYDVLRQLGSSAPDVSLLVTLGSPLGIERVQTVLQSWSEGDLPFPPGVRRWLNVADPRDPVALDKDLRDDFPGPLENVVAMNEDSPDHPHCATGYLRVKEVRQAVGEVMGWDRRGEPQGLP
jgi:hypothetical protein